MKWANDDHYYGVDNDGDCTADTHNDFDDYDDGDDDCDDDDDDDDIQEE